MRKHNFKELKVWKLAIDLSSDIYRVSKHFPKEELFGLTLQIRKCAVSIPSNIAEGCGRGTDAYLINFLNIAQGSAFELETQTIIANNQSYISTNDWPLLLNKIMEVQKMIEGFRSSLENKKP